MGKEIERKFLLRENGKNYATLELLSFCSSIEELKETVLEKGKVIKQGYLSLKDGQRLSNQMNLGVDFNPTEARLRNKSEKLSFTLKGEGGISRDELEIEMEEYSFQRFWPLTIGKRVEKIRYNILYHNHTLEIDVYLDRDLIVAEIEVPTIKEASFIIALGLDVTENPKYKNKNLAR